MSNNEIVEIVYRNYNIEKIIIKNIASSTLDDSYKDLASYIYLTLLTMDNERLNILYNTKKLKLFIIGIICNQRNIHYSMYNKFYRYKEKEEVPDLQDDTTYNYEKYYKLDFINEMLKNNHPMEKVKQLDPAEQYNFFSLEILKLYIKKKATGENLTHMSKEMKISRNVISEAIQNAKQLIKKEYEKQWKQ